VSAVILAAVALQIKRPREKYLRKKEGEKKKTSPLIYSTINAALLEAAF